MMMIVMMIMMKMMMIMMNGGDEVVDCDNDGSVAVDDLYWAIFFL